MGAKMKTEINANDRSDHPTDLMDINDPASCPNGSVYQIRVKGQLGREWSDWFEGLELQPLENGEMILSGRIVDQAALMGILTKLNRLNLALISLQPPEK
jgi:hypothetical protein